MQRTVISRDDVIGKLQLCLTNLELKEWSIMILIISSSNSILVGLSTLVHSNFNQKIISVQQVNFSDLAQSLDAPSLACSSSCFVVKNLLDFLEICDVRNRYFLKIFINFP